MLGLIIFLSAPALRVHRIQYEYPANKFNQLPVEFQSDTFYFTPDVVPIRNFITSFSDTLQESGINRGEIKIYFPEEKDSVQLQKYFSSLYDFPVVHKATFDQNVFSIRQILIYAILGLFIGVIVFSFRAANAKTKASTPSTEPFNKV